jgi:HlyD family secretion protein
MRRRNLWIGGAVLLVALVAVGPCLLPRPPITAAFQTAKVSRGALEATVSASGTLRPVDEVEVGSAVSGRIVRIVVDYNSHVKAGQVLAEIDPSAFRARVSQCEAAAARARATLQQAEFDLKRQHELASEKLLASADLERSLTVREQARADLQQVEAQLASARVDLANTVIRAPIEGVVLSRKVDAGQTVAASLQAPTLFLIARDLADMQLETSVDEADIGRVREGQDVRFTVDAYPGTKFTGRVHQVRLESTTTSGVVTYTVVIRTRNEDGRLRPGMTADVVIAVAHCAQALLVPNAALRVTEADIKGTAVVASGDSPDVPAVFVLHGGRPERVAVSPGISDGVSTAVVAAGLTAGDAVITQVERATPAAPGARSPLGGFGPPAGIGRKRL